MMGQIMVYDSSKDRLKITLDTDGSHKLLTQKNLNIHGVTAAGGADKGGDRDSDDEGDPSRADSKKAGDGKG